MCKQSFDHWRFWTVLVVIISLLCVMPASVNADDPNLDGGGSAIFLPVISGGAATTPSMATVFPVGLAVASPVHMENVVMAAAAESGWTSGYAIAAAEIYSVLAGATAVTDVFDPAGLMARSGNAECYGPMLKYRNHPNDTGGGSVVRELPHGDLGMWQEVDRTGDSCAAAQLNARLSSAEQQSQASLLLIAAMIDAVNDAGLSLPTAGGVLDITAEMNAAGIPSIVFTAATITYDLAHNVWTYYAAFEYTDPHDGSVHEMVVTLDYSADPAMPETQYSGVMYFRANEDLHTGNCSGGGGGGGVTQMTVNGSLAFNRLAANDLHVQQRTGAYCGYDVDARTNGVVDPTLGWGDNFSTFTANFDPTTMAGDYAYAWQAGVNDRATRVLNIGINSHAPLDGEAYFGYGDRVQDDADGVHTPTGMYCNWAGPGASGGMQPYAQRQFVAFNSGTGHFETPAGGSDLRYAPVNNCQYDGSGSFWYDRNLNDVEDESADDLVVTPTSTNPLDMMEAVDTDGDGVATIAEKIASRGYREPVAP